MIKEIFPEELFKRPKAKPDGNPDWHFMEEPLNKRLIEQDIQNSDALRRALNTNLTEDFFSSIYEILKYIHNQNFYLLYKY